MRRSAESSAGERMNRIALEGRFVGRIDADPDASERVEQDTLAGFAWGTRRTCLSMRIGRRLARFRLQVDPSAISVVVSSLSASWRFLGPYRSPSVRRGLALARFVRVEPNARLAWN